MIRAILTDIEGTTSSISFVKEVLFPYSYSRMADFVAENPASCAPILDSVRSWVSLPGLDTAACIAQLREWIEADQKITPLKTLQGMIWTEGYRRGDFGGHVYADAARWLRRWAAAGLRLYVYSSGSVAAQKLIFGYSDRGDLTHLFAGYFDTEIGSKLESASYQNIAQKIKLPAAEVLFLSDSAGELSAAQKAGMKLIGLDRSGQNHSPDFDFVSDFDQIGFSFRF